LPWGWIVNITKWDAGTWIAAVGAVIALLAALASWLQARLAKRAARAADVQAAAAQVQAAAATEQVIIMRQQLENEKADRLRAAGPGFTFPEAVIAEPEKGKPPEAQIQVRQAGGPKLSEVTVTVQTNGNVLGLVGRDSDDIVDSVTWTDNGAGSVHWLKVRLAESKQFNVVLDFESVGTEPGETWTDSAATVPRKRITFGSTS
jgi:hypothetical protein